MQNYKQIAKFMFKERFKKSVIYWALLAHAIIVPKIVKREWSPTELAIMIIIQTVTLI